MGLGPRTLPRRPPAHSLPREGTAFGMRGGRCFSLTSGLSALLKGQNYTCVPIFLNQPPSLKFEGCILSTLPMSLSVFTLTVAG